MKKDKLFYIISSICFIAIIAGILLYFNKGNNTENYSDNITQDPICDEYLGTQIDKISYDKDKSIYVLYVINGDRLNRYTYYGTDTKEIETDMKQYFYPLVSKNYSDGISLCEAISDGITELSSNTEVYTSASIKYDNNLVRINCSTEKDEEGVLYATAQKFKEKTNITMYIEIIDYSNIPLK